MPKRKKDSEDPELAHPTPVDKEFANTREGEKATVCNRRTYVYTSDEEEDEEESDEEEQEDTATEEGSDEDSEFEKSLNEKMGEFGITKVKEGAIDALINDPNRSDEQTERLAIAVDTTFGLLAYAHREGDKETLSKFIQSKMNEFGGCGGTRQEFELVANTMLEGDQSLPEETYTEWLDPFYWLIDVAGSMPDLFTSDKTRYEVARTIVAMPDMPRAMMALVVSDSIVNLAREGDSSRLVGDEWDKPDKELFGRKHALGQLTEFVNAGGTEEELRRVLIVVAQLDTLPNFDWAVYRGWVESYAIAVRKLRSGLDIDPDAVTQEQVREVFLDQTPDKQMVAVTKAFLLIRDIIQAAPEQGPNARADELCEKLHQVRLQNVCANRWNRMLKGFLVNLAKPVPAYLDEAFTTFQNNLRQRNQLQDSVRLLGSDGAKAFSESQLNKLRKHAMNEACAALRLCMMASCKAIDATVLNDDLRTVMLLNTDVGVWENRIRREFAGQLNPDGSIAYTSEWVRDAMQEFGRELKETNEKIELKCLQNSVRKQVLEKSPQGSDEEEPFTLLTVEQETALASRVTSSLEGITRKQFHVAGEVVIALWAMVIKQLVPGCEPVSEQILNDKVAKLKKIGGVCAQIETLSNVFRDEVNASNDTPAKLQRAEKLWDTWIWYCRDMLRISATVQFREGTIAERETRWDFGEEMVCKRGRGGAAAQWFEYALARYSREIADCVAEMDTKLPPFITDGASMYPSIVLANLDDKRSLIDQICIISYHGGCRWIDQSFHPAGTCHGIVQSLQQRLTFRTALSSGTNPDVERPSYKAVWSMLTNCELALIKNEPDLFVCSAFHAKHYAGECLQRWKPGRLTLSSKFSELHDVLSSSNHLFMAKTDEDRKRLRVSDSRVKWASKVRELATMRNPVATCILDALCVALLKYFDSDICDDVFLSPPFNDAHAMRKAYTDCTAPSYLIAYWDSAHPGGWVRHLYHSTRWACYKCVRALFPDTVITAGLAEWAGLHADWRAAVGLEPSRNNFMDSDDRMYDNNGEHATDHYTECHVNNHQVANVISESVNSDNCFLRWTMRELMAAASGMIWYGLKLRERVLETDDEQPLVDWPDRAPMMKDAYANLGLAVLLLKHAKTIETCSDVARCDVRKLQVSTGLKWAARMLEDAVQTATLWKKHQQKRAAQQTMAKRRKEEAQARAAAEAERADKERAREERTAVSDFVGRVLATVRANLNAEWVEAEAARKREAQQLEKEQRREAERLAKEAKRQAAERKAMLARVIQINREAAARREAHLAKRAVLEKKAAEREKREEAERAKERERKHWEAERAKHKAEEEERAARIHRELVAEQRARERRQAEEAARAAAEAARAAREREAARVAEEQRLREAEAEARRAAEVERQRRLQVAREREIEDVRLREAAAASAAAKQATERASVCAALARWREAAAARKAEKLEEARRQTREHCNAIMRRQAENIKQREADAQAKLKQPPPKPPKPPSPPLEPPPPAPEAAKDAKDAEQEPSPSLRFTECVSNEQWTRDYQNEHARLKRVTQMEWSTGTGWATGLQMMVQMYGPEYVKSRMREREQWDVSRATFRANAKHMERARKERVEQVKADQARETKEAEAAFEAQMSVLKDKRRLLGRRKADMDKEIQKFDKQTEQRRREHSENVCRMLRSRPQSDASATTSSMASAQVHECVICFDAPCTHLSTACGHVIGCRTCCENQRECPICRVATAFVEMRFPR